MALGRCYFSSGDVSMTKRSNSFLWCLALSLSLLSTGCLSSARLHPFVGDWVLKYAGSDLMKMRIDAHRGQLQGTLIMPRSLHETHSGLFDNVNGPEISCPIHGRMKQDGVVIMRSGEPYRWHYPMKLQDANTVSLKWTPKEPDWTFRRSTSFSYQSVRSTVDPGCQLPDKVKIRGTLFSLLQKDRGVRSYAVSSSSSVDQITAKATTTLAEIINCYGWPKISLVGQDAVSAFVELLQYQPLDLREKVLPLMEAAVPLGEASASDYAFLYDAVRVEEGRPQLWGTQVYCGETGPVAYEIADFAHLQERRDQLALVPEAAYLSSLNSRCP
jgi:hypothetical protein